MHEQLQEIVDGVRLTPSQRRIAQCLFEHAAAVPYMSAAEVAALASVSQPSVTRFAVALGFDGYPALRRALRSPGAGEPPGPVEPAGSDLPGSDLRHAIHGEIDNLHRLADRLADGSSYREDIATAAGLLAASRPLPVVGLRAAAPLAAYFGYFAAKVLPEVRVLDHGGSLLADRLEQARGAGATAMLGVVLPRYPREAVTALRDARAAGLAVVALTDSPVSAVAEAADVTLHARVGSRLVFDLHTAPMVLAMVLLRAICDAAPEQTYPRLEEFETSAARRGIFTA